MRLIFRSPRFTRTHGTLARGVTRQEGTPRAQALLPARLLVFAVLVLITLAVSYVLGIWTTAGTGVR
jgi:hypothetical protein